MLKERPAQPIMARLRQMERAADARIGMRRGWAIWKDRKVCSKGVCEMKLRKEI